MINQQNNFESVLFNIWIKRMVSVPTSIKRGFLGNYGNGIGFGIPTHLPVKHNIITKMSNKSWITISPYAWSQNIIFKRVFEKWYM